jgi:hypothetical protein
MTIKGGEQISGATIFVGQDAAGLRGKLQTDNAIREGTTVHLVPVEREQTNNVLRYSEALVKSDSTFAFRNLAPGRYFILSRIEAPVVETEIPRRPISWDPMARVTLRRDAEAGNTTVELKPCQRVVDYAVKATQ